ncbi:helix-turn-helix domain-containing protein [Phytohabitans kaempferiae]|uniref:Helix-turn-helix domain-containing protein n=1 Tax=Phytohabitans kaempferiae TaxID=1620943 RepID=A0ABV6MCJ7_9ACTN
MRHGEALLGPDEEWAYRVLVKLGVAHADQVAERMSLPPADGRRLLDELGDKGLVAADGTPPVYRPLPPEPALGAELLRRQESLEEARRALAVLSEEYLTSARRRYADRLVQVVVGAAALRERIRHLQDSAKSEMLWLCRANAVAMESAENTEEFDALDRGVRYQVIYERALLMEPGMQANVADGIRRGEQARSLRTLPVRLAVADRTTAICPLIRGDEGDVGEPSAAIIGRSQLLDALIALFESHWDVATPVRLDGGLPDEEPDLPDESERFVLSLLVAGVPDKSIASQMGVSRRTVQRRLDRLMALAGVDTRPGLAFQAARRGWL